STAAAGNLPRLPAVPALPSSNDIAPPTTQPSTLPLHDALPIFELLVDHVDGDHGSTGDHRVLDRQMPKPADAEYRDDVARPRARDRKSTRLNSSHRTISYAVFCLKKKNKPVTQSQPKIMLVDVD